MENFTEKSALRQYAKALRKDLPIKDYSKTISEELKSSIFYKEAKNILIYSSFSYETDTKEILKDKTKQFFLPRINKSELDVCPYEFTGKCLKNSYGILEPLSAPIKDLSEIEIAIVPALCADKRGFRLGYGKGYYDKLLPKLNKECKKVIILPEELVFDKIPNEEFDIRCDIIITQRNIMYI